MTLRSPNLDDRNFDQLLAEAKARVLSTCPQWELSPSDPATVLLDAFSHLTEVMIYRLNRLPEKAYIEFLNLLGLRMQPPTAASVELTFTRPRATDSVTEIPRGSRVTIEKPTGSQEPPIFVTSQPAVIPAGKTETRAIAYNAELVVGELAGYGTGKPGMSVTVKRAPIVEATSDDLRLIVGIETSAANVGERVPSIRFKDKVYRIWNEVDNFTNLDPGSTSYLVDRVSGVITFAPAVRMKKKDGTISDQAQALAAIPESGKEIRVWYWCRGGAQGNVAAETLKTLRDAVPGVSVTNHSRASGGRNAESLQNALVRGPEEFRSLERAVTASDFELLAKRNGAVARAKAFARAQVWAHAQPGTVEVLLVPEFPADALETVLDSKQVAEYHTANAQAEIQDLLDSRCALSTKTIVSWARCKTARVHARVVAYREEDAAAIQQRVLKRLYQRLNPVSWQFGQALRASHVYDMLLAEPGVNYVENLSFQVDDVPHQDVPWIERDLFQRKTWHAACGDSIFRSMNDGDSWERTGTFPGETAKMVSAHPRKAGLLAAVTATPGDGQQNAIYFSFDDGESWSAPTSIAFSVEGLAWMLRDGTPVLLMATGAGLYEIALDGPQVPTQILVDPKQPNHGFSAVAVITDIHGGTSVAVASNQNAGIFLSSEAARGNSFRVIGLQNEYIRVLTSQFDGPRSYLWAGFGAAAGGNGSGAARIELLGSEVSSDGWQRYAKNWKGGSCWSLAIRGAHLYAATFQSGILRHDITNTDAGWVAPDISCGLPQRGVERIFQTVRTVAAAAESDTILCGGPAGVYRSTDGGDHYDNVSSPTYQDKVTLPETWLFCSGEHQIEVKQDEQQ